MTTTVNGVELESKSSKIIQAWIREVNFHDVRGNPVTLRKACEFIIEDFANVLSKDENLLAVELKQQEMIANARYPYSE